MLRALLALAEAQAERLQLLLVERILQMVEHVLGAALLGFVRQRIAQFEHVAEHPDLRPQIEIAEPHHKLANGARPCLIVQDPEGGSFLPCRENAAMG